MRKILTLVALSAVFLGQGPSWAQTGEGSGEWRRPGAAAGPGADGQAQYGEGEGEEQGEAERLSPDDFIYLASVAILFDMEVARLAMEKAQDGSVRAFAGRILADRQESLERLRSSAAASNAPLELDEDNRRIVEALGKEQAADFDASFVGMMVDAHEDALDLYEEFRDAAVDDRLRDFVASRIEALRALLEEARSLDAAMEGAQGSPAR
ncbi:MAG: DUF4142 domain-containing protein [Beijerinckiaceae bacterium]|nr:DUF4142 domain-containing protein [Beijerinckiaceae bacterium]